MFVKISSPVGSVNLNMSLESMRKLLEYACTMVVPEEVEMIETSEEIKNLVTDKPVIEEEPKKIPYHKSKAINKAAPEKMIKPEKTEPVKPVKPAEMDKPVYEDGYKGFLLIKCRECGELKGFCAKERTKQYRCSCGGVTPLEHLHPAFLRCECGKNWKYRTNITDPIIEYNCLECGAPVDLFYNEKKHVYEKM